MLGLFSVIAAAAALGMPQLDPAHLPRLPGQGLVLADQGGLTLLDLRGRKIGRLHGFGFVTDHLLAPGLPRLRDARGRRWRLELGRHRLVRAEHGMPLSGGASLTVTRRLWEVRRHGRVILHVRVGRMAPFISEDADVVSTARGALDVRNSASLRVPHGCVVASRRSPNWILLCGRSAQGTPLPTSIGELVDGRSRRIAGPPVGRASDGQIHGYWSYVRVSPDGRSLLAQWSGECESPAAYIVERASGKIRPAGAPAVRRSFESIGLGWTRDGRAIVHYTAGVCAAGFHGGPGVYVLAPNGRPRLVTEVDPRRGGFALWG